MDLSLPCLHDSQIKIRSFSLAQLKVKLPQRTPKESVRGLVQATPLSALQPPTLTPGARAARIPTCPRHITRLTAMSVIISNTSMVARVHTISLLRHLKGFFNRAFTTVHYPMPAHTQNMKVSSRWASTGGTKRGMLLHRYLPSGQIGDAGWMLSLVDSRRSQR